MDEKKRIRYFKTPEVQAAVTNLIETILKVNGDQKMVTFAVYADVMTAEGESAAAFMADSCTCESCLAKFAGIVGQYLDAATPTTARRPKPRRPRVS